MLRPLSSLLGDPRYGGLAEHDCRGYELRHLGREAATGSVEDLLVDGHGRIRQLLVREAGGLRTLDFPAVVHVDHAARRVEVGPPDEPHAVPHP